MSRKQPSIVKWAEYMCTISVVGRKMHDIYLEMNSWHNVKIVSTLWCIVIFIFAYLLFCVEGKGTLEHLARDEVAIGRQIGSILIYKFIHLIHSFIYWFMAFEPTRFDTDVKFYMHICMVIYGGMIQFNLGLIKS